MNNKSQKITLGLQKLLSNNLETAIEEATRYASYTRSRKDVQRPEDAFNNFDIEHLNINKNTVQDVLNIKSQIKNFQNRIEDLKTQLTDKKNPLLKLEKVLITKQISACETTITLLEKINDTINQIKKKSRIESTQPLHLKNLLNYESALEEIRLYQDLGYQLNKIQFDDMSFSDVSVTQLQKAMLECVPLAEKYTGQTEYNYNTIFFFYRKSSKRLHQNI